jgi:lipoprotein NlpD
VWHAPKVEPRPLDAPAACGTAAPVPAPAPPPAAVGGAGCADPGRDATVAEEAWPVGRPGAGRLRRRRNKGLAIAGKAGDPVLAAADGRVVYAGSGLRGYGNLVIVKHNDDLPDRLCPQPGLLVKEDQAVRRGQKIAEMGSSDAERVQLHFEIRRQGKPVDPARLLPPR